MQKCRICKKIIISIRDYRKHLRTNHKDIDERKSNKLVTSLAIEIYKQKKRELKKIPDYNKLAIDKNFKISKGDVKKSRLEKYTSIKKNTFKNYHDSTINSLKVILTAMGNKR